MSSGGTAAAQFPIRFADIIFAEVLDPNGQNLRRAELWFSRRHRTGGWIPHCGRWGDGQLPNPLTADYVKLPYKIRQVDTRRRG